jgi:hypothetical protein
MEIGKGARKQETGKGGLDGGCLSKIEKLGSTGSLMAEEEESCEVGNVLGG